MNGNIVDAAICDALSGLNKIIELHKRLKSNGVESPGFYPDEVLDYAEDVRILRYCWDSSDYVTIRDKYVDIWVRYYEDLYLDVPSFEKKEYLDGTAQQALTS